MWENMEGISPSGESGPGCGPSKRPELGKRKREGLAKATSLLEAEQPTLNDIQDSDFLLKHI